MAKEVKKAVALGYDMQTQNAPKVLATGKGETAQKIITLAKENSIAIKEDKDLVEILSKLDLGDEVPPNMYKVVAEIFSFIYQMSNKHKQN